MTLLFELLAVAVLILLNGFFVAAEYGLVTVRRTRMHELAHYGSRRARQVLRITDSPPRFIAAMQLGVTLTSLGIGALGEHALSRLFDPVVATVLAVIIAYLLLTFFHVVIGELVPKAIALGHSERTALAVATPVRAFFTVTGPLIWLLRRSTQLVLGLFGLEEPGAEDARQRIDRARRDRGGRAGDALQGLRFRGQRGQRRHGAEARGGRPVGGSASRAGAAGGARVAVHALSRLPRHARRDRRRAARARPDPGDARARDRIGRDRRSRTAVVHGPGDEGSRCSAEGVPEP